MSGKMDISNQQPQIAVVDDDESLCKALSRLLRASGMKPTCYFSAEAFLARQDALVPDCLVLDVQLSGMSGLDLQREMPIVFITAYVDPRSQEQAQTAGCFAYLQKIAPGEVVLQTIKESLRATLPAAQKC
jgi:FixJ family two-component response regulator